MATVIDFSAAYPSPAAVKRAGHDGVMLYLSPPRETWMGGKRITRAVVDNYKNAGLKIALCWQYGAGNPTDSDVMRGAAGGRADAEAAQTKLTEIGLPGHPVFFCVDFDIKLNQWNNVAAAYFKAACDVLGRDQVGIYGHSRVIAWAQEDGLVADLGGGRVLGWQTPSWSNGVRTDRAVLYQGIHNVPGPDGVQIDINTVLHNYWGQSPPNTPAPKPGKEEPVAKDYLDVQPDKIALLGKNFNKGRAGQKIRFIVLHHTAGVLDADAINRVWSSRPASTHYLVDPNGIVSQHVWDADTAWSTGSTVGNQQGISIEHSNSAGAAQDWPINQATLTEGARWVASLCLFYNLGRPVLGQNVRPHRDFSATSCPYHLAPGGKYINAYMAEAQRFYDELVAKKNGTTPASEPEPEPEEKKEVPAMGTTLDTRFPGFVDPEIDGTIADWCRHSDRNSFNTLVEVRALRAEIAELRNELKGQR